VSVWKEDIVGDVSSLWEGDEEEGSGCKVSSLWEIEESENQEESIKLVESKSSSTKLELEVDSKSDQWEGRELVWRQWVVVK
jgi:hypothetical protein